MPALSRAVTLPSRSESRGQAAFPDRHISLALSQAEPPAVIMDHDADMIRVVEGGCAPIERGIIEVPLRRSELPNELRKIAPVFVVAGPAAFRGKIKTGTTDGAQPLAAMAPCRIPGCDQITTRGDHGLAALRPERRDDVGRPRSPIKTGEGRLLDFERIHQGDDIDSERRWLAIADRFT